MEDTLSENDFRPRYFNLSGKYWHSLTSVHSVNDDVTLILAKRER